MLLYIYFTRFSSFHFAEVLLRFCLLLSFFFLLYFPQKNHSFKYKLFILHGWLSRKIYLVQINLQFLRVALLYYLLTGKLILRVSEMESFIFLSKLELPLTFPIFIRVYFDLGPVYHGVLVHLCSLPSLFLSSSQVLVYLFAFFSSHGHHPNSLYISHT